MQELQTECEDGPFVASSIPLTVWICKRFTQFVSLLCDQQISIIKLKIYFMKKFFSLVVIGASVLAASCKKESNNVDPAEGPSKKLIQSTLNPTTSITYNPDGKPKEITFQKPSGEVSKKIFAYAAGKTSFTWVANGKITETGEYTIVDGKPTAYKWTYFDANEQPAYTLHESFTYNPKGLTEKHIYDNGKYWQYQYDINDNLVLGIFYDAQGTALQKIEYAYGNQKDLFPMYNYFDAWGDGFIQVPFSKYLPISLKTTDLQTQQVLNQATFAYELDGDGYVTKGKWHKIIGSSNDWEWTNIYQ
jgi:hypothetical protein